MIFQLFDFQPALNVQFNPFPLRNLFPYIEEIQIPLKAKGLIIDMSVKNDDSVKVAPAYCRNFLAESRFLRQPVNRVARKNYFEK